MYCNGARLKECNNGIDFVRFSDSYNRELYKMDEH